MDKNKILVIYGKHPMEMAESILEAAGIETMIDKDMNIVIKPNLVVAKPSSSGATTSPKLVEGVIKYLKNMGCENISIMESSWVGDSTKRAFKVCGYEEISQKYKVPLIDLKRDKTKILTYMGDELEVCLSPLKADFLINMPVLKAHCQTRLTCALKNLKGCIPDREKRRFHALGLHRPIALLNKFITSHLVVVDGIMGDLTFEEGGTPVEMNRVILGRDPVLVDTYGAQLLGYSVEDIPYITYARQLGIGNTSIKDDTVIKLNSDRFTPGDIKAGRKVARLAKHILEDQACSACYGSLIHGLQRMDEINMLKDLKEKVHIGQGYKGKTVDGIGIGSCCSGFEHNLKGCPPNAKDIIDFLQQVSNKGKEKKTNDN
ncbi:MAG TPA: DUF362 domain-containing protein [Clostridiales bacterium]|nr:DUF362 domain-containing protein [Clostridiales bacterium]